MLKEVAEAIERHDYKTAEYLLQTWQQQEIDNPWVVFYTARLAEVKGHLKSASQQYRELLQQTTNLKLIGQIRQRMECLDEIDAQNQQKVKEERLKAIAQANRDPVNQEPGIFILEPIPNEAKKQAAQQFAQIMQLDPYTARLQLPSRAWRFYRTGTIGELQILKETLKSVTIPCFCATLKDIQNIKVYQINYFLEIYPIVTVVCHTNHGKPTLIKFEPSELVQRVEGILPVFEECLEVGIRRKMERRTRTLDYIQFCDLHLKERNIILRLCAQTYKYHQGFAFLGKNTIDEATSRDHWNHLITYFKERFPQQSVYSEFTPFAETAFNFPETLKLIEPNLELLRREDTLWDQAFHLYSSLAFLKKS